MTSAKNDSGPLVTRQNLLTYSEDLSQTSGGSGWLRLSQGTPGHVITANAAVGPNGTKTATSLALTTGDYLQQNNSLNPIADCTFSVWLKGSESSRFIPAVSLGPTGDPHDNVSIPYHTSIQAGAGSFVMALWFRPSATSIGEASSHVIVSTKPSAYDGGILVNQFAANLAVYNKSLGPTSQFTIFAANTWYRIVLVGDADAGTLKTYVNGVLQATATGQTFTVSSTEATRIGSALDISVCSIAHHRDYVICKAGTPGFAIPSLADVEADYAGTADFGGISARYPLNEGTGTSLAASVGGGGNATLSGGAWYPSISIQAGDCADGVPVYASSCVLTASWQRFNVVMVKTGASSTCLACLILSGEWLTTTAYAWGALYNPGLTPGAYVKTTSAPTPHNLLTYSSDFSNAAWGKNDLTVAINQANGPFSVMDADKITDVNATSGAHFLYQDPGFTPAADAPLVASVYAKAIASSNCFLVLGGSGGAVAAFFDLNAGTVTLENGCAATITAVGDGWYRCSIAYVQTGVSTVPVIYSAVANGEATYPATGTDRFYLWGAQLNTGTVLLPHFETIASRRTSETVPLGWQGRRVSHG